MGQAFANVTGQVVDDGEDAILLPEDTQDIIMADDGSTPGFDPLSRRRSNRGSQESESRLSYGLNNFSLKRDLHKVWSPSSRHPGLVVVQAHLDGPRSPLWEPGSQVWLGPSPGSPPGSVPMSIGFGRADRCFALGLCLACSCWRLVPLGF